MPFSITTQAAGAAARQRTRGGAAPWTQLEEELRGLLMATWAIRTGRSIPRRPLDELSARELIEFWADEQTATALQPSR
jgi:hypothetical protein